MRAKLIPHFHPELGIVTAHTRRDGNEYRDSYLMYPDQWKRVFGNRPERNVWPNWYRWVYRIWKGAI